MWPAQQRALDLRARHAIVGVPDDATLDAILAAEGLTVEANWPFVGRVREVYAAGVLGLRDGLSPGWVRWLKCHGLGHHLQHRGNHLYMSDGLHLWQLQEIEAEVFAGTLLVSARPELPAGLGELAARAGVPPECLRSWQASCLYLFEQEQADLRLRA